MADREADSVVVVVVVVVVLLLHCNLEPGNEAHLPPPR